jgi:circadian clock protein KaiC
MGIEFLVRGATQFNEPGLFMSFEESDDKLAENVRSLGIDLRDLEAKKKIALDYAYIERSEIVETGGYDLEGLFLKSRGIEHSNRVREFMLNEKKRS